MVHLCTELHLSVRAIARRMNIAKSTVQNLLKKYHETGDVKDLPRSGRKRKLSEPEEKRVIRKAKKESTASDIARDYARETGKSIHRTTIQRTLHEHGFFYLVKQQVEALSVQAMQNRLTYAQDMIGFQWKKVLFSDEKTFQLGSSTTHAWQQIGHRRTQAVTKHPPKVHVWAAAGFYFNSPLYFFTQDRKSVG